MFHGQSLHPWHAGAFFLWIVGLRAARRRAAPETNPHDRTLRYWTLPQNKLCRLVVAIMGNGGRVNMSKFLLTLCAFGLFFSSALAQEKSLEELDKRSNS
jgi:hypothetical protein